MNANGWLQVILYVGVLAAFTKPIGAYLAQVLDRDGRTWLDPLIRPFERWTYRLLGVDAEREQDWRGYGLSMLAFSGVGLVFTYALLRLQEWLPLNPQAFGAMGPDLAFNTAVSFTTNTNWQSYGGESTLSYFSQMVGLTFQNFTSAAVGIGIAAVLVRSLARHSTRWLGNFWVDLIRIHYYLLIPASVVLALFLVSQGVVQNFRPYVKGRLVVPIKVQIERTNDAGETRPDADGKPVVETTTVAEQWIPQGPMASQVAIKMLGTNGGGFLNANAAHPFENPTPLSNFIQMLTIFAIGSGLTHYLGRATGNPAHGWAVWSAMMAIFFAGVLVC